MKSENPALQVIDLLLVRIVLAVLIRIPKAGDSVGHSQMYLGMGLVAVPPLLPHAQSCLSSNCRQPFLLMLLQFVVICQGGSCLPFGCILIRKGFLRGWGDLITAVPKPKPRPLLVLGISERART